MSVSIATKGVIFPSPGCGRHAGNCYEKVSSHVVGIDCCDIEDTRKEDTIAGLRDKKAVFELEKADTIVRWDGELSDVDTEITTVDDHIAAAEALGILE